MSEKEGWFTRISAESIKELLLESMRTWIWPICLPLLTAILGYLQGLPLMYILLGALLAFALITHGLQKIAEWRILKNPEDKIDYLEPNIGAIYNKNDPDKYDGIVLGFKLKNIAFFPIEVEIADIHTVFDNRIPQQGLSGPKLITVGIGGSMFYNDAAIDIRGVDLAKKEIKATVKFAVKYGVPGNRKYKYGLSHDIHFHFDDNGRYKTHSWNLSFSQSGL